MTEIWIIVALLIGIVIGRFWDMQGKPRERKGGRARERPDKADRETDRETAVRNRQVQNMLNYNGDTQQKIDPSTILERR